MDGYNQNSAAAPDAAPPVAQDPAYPPVQPYQQPAGQVPYPQAQAPYPTNSAYPPGQYDAPPSYYPPEKQPMPVQQQGNVEVKIVQQQPATRTVYVTSHPVQDRFLVMSIIMVFCGFFCGFAFLLCCLPALFISISARDDDRNGDHDSARTKGRISLGLNLAGIVCWVIFFIVAVAINISNNNNRVRVR